MKRRAVNRTRPAPGKSDPQTPSSFRSRDHVVVASRTGKGAFKGAATRSVVVPAAWSVIAGGRSERVCRFRPGHGFCSGEGELIRSFHRSEPVQTSLRIASATKLISIFRLHQAVARFAAFIGPDVKLLLSRAFSHCRNSAASSVTPALAI